ncbi:MAG: electron transfer flavoprotein subunit beta/FixA family protein [Pseudomonadota bacterium]
MRIIVCVKQICQTYARSGMDPERYFLNPEDAIVRVNPYDEVALELALRVKDVQNGGEIIAVTLGPIIAEAELRRCLAMGADTLYQVEIEEGVDPWGKSNILARVVKELGADIVLCGKESLDKQNGQVGAFMAHHLGMPFVSGIVDLSIPNRETARVHRPAGRGVREVIECPLPAVFSVDMGMHEPRLPTYQDKIRARSMRIQRLAHFEEMPANKTISTRLFPPRPRPKQMSAPDSRQEAFYRIEQLLAGSRIEKKGIVLRGSPGSQAEGIVAFLEEHGFLKSQKAQEEE